MDADTTAAAPNRRRRRQERGQAYAEYGLIVVIIGIGAILLLLVLGHTIGSTYTNIGTSVGSV